LAVPRGVWRGRRCNIPVYSRRGELLSNNGQNTVATDVQLPKEAVIIQHQLFLRLIVVLKPFSGETDEGREEKRMVGVEFES
jgi:hypothetical protein